MWVFLSDAFLSIVADTKQPEMLKVRARFEGDIERTFPGAQVKIDAGTDYKYRAWIPRDEVAKMLAEQARTLTATNFKSSVGQRCRHDVYMDVWNTLSREQARRSGLKSI